MSHRWFVLMVGVLGLLLAACGEQQPGDASAFRNGTSADTSAGRTEAGAVRWFFALADGSVVMREPEGAQSVILKAWSEEPSEDDLARRQYPGARELAYDAARQTLWFADTHEAIHSVRLADGVRGPSIDGFADVALPGCSVANLSREFAVLGGTGEVIVPTLIGTTLLYSIQDGEMVSAFRPSEFGGPLLGQFRPFIADPAGTLLWYADTHGVLHEADSTGWALTGRAVGPLPGAPASAFVEAAIDPSSGVLVYLRLDGTLGAIDLVTGAAVEPPIEAPAGTQAIAAG